MSLQSRRTLYVGGLAEDVDDKMLRAAFITFGPIQSIDIPQDYTTTKNVSHKGFAFVEFEDADDAADAIENMDGSELQSKTLMVSLAQPSQVMSSMSSSSRNSAAVWSTDEWFQQHSGMETEEQRHQRQMAKLDEQELKEHIPLKG